MIRFACSRCKKAIKTEDENAGKKAKCPGCQQPLLVPEHMRPPSFPVVDPPVVSDEDVLETRRAGPAVDPLYRNGQLDQLEQFGVADFGGAVEWSIAGDKRDCALCRPLKGIVLATDEALGMMPRHESCRCSWVPANVGEDKRGQKRTRASIPKAIDKSIVAEILAGGDQTLAALRSLSSWPGATKTIAKERPKSIVD